MSGECSAKPVLEQGRGVLRAARLLWLAFALALVVKTLAGPEIHTVFPKFAAGAQHWWAGHPLYADYPKLGPFRYSPTFSIAMTPFAPAGLGLGGVLWSLINVGAYMWGVQRLARDVLPGKWPPGRVGLLLALALPAAIRGFWNAQSHTLVAACLLLGTAAVVRRRWWLAAALLAATVYLKLAPLAVALLLVALVPASLGPRFLATLLLGGLLPFLTQSPAYVAEQYRAWFDYLVETGSTRWPNFRDARTLWEWAGVTTNLRAYAGLQALAGAMVLAWCWWQKRRSEAQVQTWVTLTLGAGIAYLLLFGPAVESAGYVMLAPLAAWAVLESLEARRGRLLAGATFVLSTVFTFGAAEGALAGAAPVVTAALPAGTLLFVAWLLDRYSQPFISHH